MYASPAGLGFLSSRRRKLSLGIERDCVQVSPRVGRKQAVMAAHSGIAEVMSAWTTGRSLSSMS